MNAVRRHCVYNTGLISRYSGCLKDESHMNEQLKEVVELSSLNQTVARRVKHVPIFVQNFRDHGLRKKRQRRWDSKFEIER